MTTARSRLRPCAGLAIAAGLIGLGLVAARGAEHLTRSDLLARAYDSILNVDFEQAARDRTAACGPAPKEACQLLALTAQRWQMKSIRTTGRATNVCSPGRSQPLAPPTFLAAAYLESARLLEAMNQRDRAIDLYRVVLHVRGAEPRTREGSVAALARLHVSERFF